MTRALPADVAQERAYLQALTERRAALRAWHLETVGTPERHAAAARLDALDDKVDQLRRALALGTCRRRA